MTAASAVALPVDVTALGVAWGLVWGGSTAVTVTVALVAPA